MSPGAPAASIAVVIAAFSALAMVKPLLPATVLSLPMSAVAHAEKASSQAPTQSVNQTSSGMKITSCQVVSMRDESISADCLAEVARLCDGRNFCGVPIGYNLTGGKDIDPKAGVIGKQVTITYVCGPIVRQRGPYEQNAHATLFLDCGGPF